MKARDKPLSVRSAAGTLTPSEAAPTPGAAVQKAPPVGAFSASGSGSKSAPTDTRISKPVKSSKHKARLPKERRRARPPKVTGYTWRKDGAGWELRKSVYVVTDTGIRKRRLPYVAHLSKSAFQELKRQHKGTALEKAIAQWIADHDR